MAGRKQHYVPRFLQAGFNSRARRNSDIPHAWLFRKGQPPVEATIKSIGQDDWFYTLRCNGVTIECADGAITNAEGAWMSGLVRRLRDDPSIDLAANHTEIAHLLSHLVIRNRAIWKFIDAPVAPLFDRLREAAQDPAWLAGTVKQLLETNRPFFEESLSVIFPGADIPALVDQAETALATETMSPQASDGAASVMTYLREDITPRLLKVLRVQTLMEALQDPSQYRLFKDCSFELVHDTEGRFIQGDAPVVFHRTNGSGFTSVPLEGEGFDYAFLPLAPSVVLVATKDCRPQSWDALRQASASCSHTYFIAAEKTQEFVALADAIALSFPTPSVQQIDEMFADATSGGATFAPEDSELLGVLDSILSGAPQSIPPEPTSD